VLIHSRTTIIEYHSSDIIPAPFMSAMKPSARITFTQQSNDPLYFTASPDVIIMRRRIVSIGYEIRPDVIVTTSHVQYTLSS